MFAAIRPGLKEPEGHFRSVFAVSTQKYGLARQCLNMKQLYEHEKMPEYEKEMKKSKRDVV